MSYTLEDSIEMHAHWASVDRWGPASPANIFYLDHDPELAAQYHADRHVVKMIAQVAQFLSTVWFGAARALVETGTTWMEGQVEPAPEGQGPDYCYALLGQHRVYRPVHATHPCTAWAAASAANYNWLWRLGMALVAEHEYRYETKHVVRPVMWSLESAPPGLSELPQAEPPLVMPGELRVVDDEGYWCAVRSYRNYYVQAKQPLLGWRRRGAPNWVRETEDGTFLLVE